MAFILVDRFWTIPNVLCFFRIFLAFFFLIHGLKGNWVPALWSFGIAAFTDLIDGTLARFLKQKSRFGGFIDPMADKLLIFFCFVVLTSREFLPLSLFIVVVLRDLVITISILTFIAKKLIFEFNPTKLSKLNTLVQILLISLTLISIGAQELHWEYEWIGILLKGLVPSIILCYVLAVVTGIQYVTIGIRLLKAQPVKS